MERTADSTPSLKEWADPMFSAPPATPPSKEAGAQKRLRSRDLPGSPCASRSRRASPSSMRNVKRAHEPSGSCGARVPTLRVLRQSSLAAPPPTDFPTALELPAPAIPTFSTPSPYHSMKRTPSQEASRVTRPVRRQSFSRCTMLCDAALDPLDSFLLPPPAIPLSAFAPTSPSPFSSRATPVSTETSGEEREQSGAHVKDTQGTARKTLIDLGTNQRPSHSPRKSDPMFELRQRSGCHSPTGRPPANLAACGAGSSGFRVSTWQLPKRAHGSRIGTSPSRAPRRLILLSSAT